jgi:hypothetical protein
MKKIKLNEKALNVINKWEEAGLLSNLNNYDVKLKVVNSFELLEKHLKNTENLLIPESLFYTIIRIVFGEDKHFVHKVKIYDNFEFNDETIIKFINYINDCANTPVFSKHITNVNVETEICIFLARIYIAEQNWKNRLKIIKKQECILEN